MFGTRADCGGPAFFFFFLPTRVGAGASKKSMSGTAMPVIPLRCAGSESAPLSIQPFCACSWISGSGSPLRLAPPTPTFIW